MSDTLVSTSSIVMVAGEPSGDMLSAQVIHQLKQEHLINLGGIGGPKMIREGFDSWYPMDKLSIFGYADALKNLPELLRIRKSIGDRCLVDRPKVFMGIDAPDFNFGLERRLREASIPTIHFVGPSIWAWRKERISKIKQAVSHMLVLFPFEPAIYQQANIPVSYVGHPLADSIPLDIDRMQARVALGELQQDDLVLTVMPGSRASELKFLAPRFLQAVELLQAKIPTLKVLVPMANEQRLTQFNECLRLYPNVKHVRVIVGRASDCLAACNTVLVASGTATLEAALFKRPMVISYVVSRVGAWFLRGRGYLPWIGLPNVLLNDFVVPELIQEQATPNALADALWMFFTDEKKVQSIENRFMQLHHELKQNTAQQVTRVLSSYL